MLTCETCQGPTKTRTAPHLLEAAQVEDRVADQLSWPVEGDESSSVGAVNVGPEQTQAVQEGGGIGFVADPGSVDRRVLAQQQSVSWNGSVPVHVDLLQLQSLLVGDQAQTDHLHHGPAALHPGLEPDQKTRTLVVVVVKVALQLKLDPGDRTLTV